MDPSFVIRFSRGVLGVSAGDAALLEEGMPSSVVATGVFGEGEVFPLWWLTRLRGLRACKFLPSVGENVMFGLGAEVDVLTKERGID